MHQTSDALTQALLSSGKRLDAFFVDVLLPEHTHAMQSGGCLTRNCFVCAHFSVHFSGMAKVGCQFEAAFCWAKGDV
jgi:hypothetical protein